MLKEIRTLLMYMEYGVCYSKAQPYTIVPVKIKKWFNSTVLAHQTTGLNVSFIHLIAA
jgi:hypothetical protein